MSSLADVDAVFFETQQAALNRDGHSLSRLIPRLRAMIGECTDIPSITHRKQLGSAAINHVNQLWQLEATQGRMISISELM